LKVLTDSFEVIHEIIRAKESRIGQLRAASTSLVIEDDEVVSGQGFQIRPNGLYPGAGPPVHDNHGIATGTSHLVEETGTIVAGEIALIPLRLLFPGTGRDGSEQEYHNPGRFPHAAHGRRCTPLTIRTCPMRAA